jgi:hypothetical protein
MEFDTITSALASLILGDTMASPVATLACVGGSDQHWQIWEMADLVPHGEMPTEMPCYTYIEGLLEAHPDGPIAN